jgi:hypothetical protein
MSTDRLRRELAKLREERAANVRCQTCAEKGWVYIVDVDWDRYPDDPEDPGPCLECGREPLEVDVDWE